MGQARCHRKIDEVMDEYGLSDLVQQHLVRAVVLPLLGRAYILLNLSALLSIL